MNHVRRYGNRLGVKGWFYGGRFGLERYLYFLQRLTGLGIIIYLLLHIVETAARIKGPETWESTMGAFSAPVFGVLEYIIFAAFIFHGLNGLRLACLELGVGLGRARRPIYPYVTSLHRSRPLMWIFMALVLALLVIGGVDFFMFKS